MFLPAERYADSAAPEVEVAEVDVEFVVFFWVSQRAEVPQVAAEADVVGGEAERAESDVDAELFVAHLEQGVRIFHVRLQDACARGHIGTETAARLAADR